MLITSPGALINQEIKAILKKNLLRAILKYTYFN